MHRQPAAVTRRAHECRRLDQRGVVANPSLRAPVGRQRARMQPDFVGNRQERQLYQLAPNTRSMISSPGVQRMPALSRTAGSNRPAAIQR